MMFALHVPLLVRLRNVNLGIILREESQKTTGEPPQAPVALTQHSTTMGSEEQPQDIFGRGTLKVWTVSDGFFFRAVIKKNFRCGKMVITLKFALSRITTSWCWHTAKTHAKIFLQIPLQRKE